MDEDHPPPYNSLNVQLNSNHVKESKLTLPAVGLGMMLFGCEFNSKLGKEGLD